MNPYDPRSVQRHTELRQAIASGAAGAMTPDPSIRYLRFEHDQYYPSGGTGDITGRGATIENIRLTDGSRYDYAYIYDTWTGEEYPAYYKGTPGPVEPDEQRA